jgi:hypothetical protein
MVGMLHGAVQMAERLGLDRGVQAYVIVIAILMVAFVLVGMG